MKKGADDLIKKFNIDTEKLESEQKKLAKLIVSKDERDFSILQFIAGCDVITISNKVIGSIVVCTPDLEVVEQKFSIQRATFPYIPGFLTYRELPVLKDCFEKIENVPDVIFIDGNGTLHPQGCGLASHFGLSVSIPTIGVAKELLCGTAKNGKVYVDGKVRGAEF
ncbi:MAG: endonuclease V, partial [Nanoarchaeota archaeon]